MNWFEQGNWSTFFSEAQKQLGQNPWTQAFAGKGVAPGAAPFAGMPFGGMPFAGMPFAGMPFAGMGAATPGASGGPVPGGAAAAAPGVGLPGFEQVNELIKQALEGWATLVPAALGGKGKGAGVDAAMLGKLFDPAQWSQVMATGPDLSLERLTEGPTYATITDLDRKILKAQQLWVVRAQAIEGYRQQVQAAWLRAFEAMRKALADPKGEPLTTARAVLDLWLKVANEALLEMHHRPEFLEAQRKMTRAAAEYRLQEQKLAEVFCALNHIPTRTEMDEAQKTIVELRRELRALQRRLDTPRAAPARRAAAKERA